MDNQKYYEEYDWSNFKDASINYDVIASLIPENVHSIIDIGCGNGLITNRLSEKYAVLGVDRSFAALENVKCNKLQASCDQVSVENESFDLVLSSELLEHLDDQTFTKTLVELKRISKKYLLLSVPFDESLNKGMVQCPSCNLIYHRCYHMRRFSLKSFEQLFPEYTLITHKTFGINVRVYNETISKLKQKLTPASAWIPYYMAAKGQRDTFCPKCETKFEYPYKFNPIAFGLDCLNAILTKKIPFHLVVLLERKN